MDLRLDHLRRERTGLAEAVYAPGKSPAQCAEAVAGLLAGPGSGPVLLTRANADQAAAAVAQSPGAVTAAAGADESRPPAEHAHVGDASCHRSVRAGAHRRHQRPAGGS